MNLEEFQQIKQLVLARENIQKTIEVIQEMVSNQGKTTDLKAKLTFYREEEDSGSIKVQFHAFLPGIELPTKPKKANREIASLGLDDIMVMLVAGTLHNYLEERIGEINQDLINLGITP